MLPDTSHLQDKAYIESLIELSGKIYKKKYKLGEVDCKWIIKPDDKEILSNFKFLLAKPGGTVDATQSSSSRGAWLNYPWKGDRYYAGLEYKGVGLEGTRIRYYESKGKRVALGGTSVLRAETEYKYNSVAEKLGVFCQKPICVYNIKHKKVPDLGVFVRTFSSPIRLWDFYKTGKINQYLRLRYDKSGADSFEKYILYLADCMSHNLSLMLPKGFIHGSLGTLNITSEGEVADFESFGSKEILDGVFGSKRIGHKLLSIFRAVRRMSFFCIGLQETNKIKVDQHQGEEIFKKYLFKIFGDLTGQSEETLSQILPKNLYKYYNESENSLGNILWSYTNHFKPAFETKI
ncbi:hypothetical protein ACFLQI_00500 [Candidatus Undinarchaeota archaeon]